MYEREKNRMANKLNVDANGILRGREANASQYLICTFKKEQMPLYAKTLQYLYKENADLARKLHFKEEAYYRPFKGDGRDPEKIVRLPNHYSMWVDGTLSNLVDVSRFWRLMFQIKQLAEEGVIKIEPYNGFISSRSCSYDCYKR